MDLLIISASLTGARSVFCRGKPTEVEIKRMVRFGRWLPASGDLPRGRRRWEEPAASVCFMGWALDDEQDPTAAQRRLPNKEESCVMFICCHARSPLGLTAGQKTSETPSWRSSRTQREDGTSGRNRKSAAGQQTSNNHFNPDNNIGNTRLKQIKYGLSLI